MSRDPLIGVIGAAEISTLNEAQTGWKAHHSPADSVADINNNICGAAASDDRSKSCEDACAGMWAAGDLSANVVPPPPGDERPPGEGPPISTPIRGRGPFEFLTLPFYE